MVRTADGRLATGCHLRTLPIVSIAPPFERVGALAAALGLDLRGATAPQFTFTRADGF